MTAGNETNSEYTKSVRKKWWLQESMQIPCTQKVYAINDDRRRWGKFRVHGICLISCGHRFLRTLSVYNMILVKICIWRWPLHLFMLFTVFFFSISQTAFQCSWLFSCIKIVVRYSAMREESCLYDHYITSGRIAQTRNSNQTPLCFEPCILQT